MRINVDVASARAVNERIPPVVNQINSTRTTVTGLQSSIDPRVLDRRNLRARLRNAQLNIETMESDLLLLHRTVAQNLTSYEDNEARLLDMVRSVPIEPRV